MKRKENGMTLVEIMAWIAVTMILTTISIPFIRKFRPNFELDGSTRDLASDLRLAQQLSVAEQIVYYIDLATSTRSYAIFKTGSSTPIKTYILPTEVSYDEVTGLSNNRISFNSYGGVSQSGSITIKNSTRSKVINIKPSGYVELR